MPATDLPPSSGRPRPLDAPADEVDAVFRTLAPDRLLHAGIPVWWLRINADRPANACLDSALILKAAFEAFEVRAEPAFVRLRVDDTARATSSVFGALHPSLDGGRLNGHVGLWLPGPARFIDQTVQQFEVVRRHGWMPALIDAPPGGEPWPRTVLTTRRGPLRLAYTPASGAASARIIDDPATRAAYARHHRRAGINLASAVLDLLRREPYLDQVMASPHPRLRRLVRAVGDTRVGIDRLRNMRFELAGTDGVRLDEIA